MGLRQFGLLITYMHARLFKNVLVPYFVRVTVRINNFLLAQKSFLTKMGYTKCDENLQSFREQIFVDNL